MIEASLFLTLLTFALGDDDEVVVAAATFLADICNFARYFLRC